MEHLGKTECYMSVLFTNKTLGSVRLMVNRWAHENHQTQLYDTCLKYMYILINMNYPQDKGKLEKK